MSDRQSHWNTVYTSKKPDAVSWYQPSLRRSLALIRNSGVVVGAPLIDVGGGASTLVDELLDENYSDITVLDISSEALNCSKARLGRRADSVTWLVSDVTACDLPNAHYAIWHDRAVFHFLVAEDDRAKYCRLLRDSVRPHGIAIIATFGPNGPPKCSGLEIARYSPDSLQATIGSSFSLIESDVEQHTTPFNATQEFIYCVFRRI